MRTVNEQKRGLYRVLGTPNAGNIVLKRVKRRLWTVEWREYLADQSVKVVCTALDTIHQCGMQLNRPLDR